MTLGDYLKTHSFKLLAQRCGVSSTSIRRYRDGTSQIPLIIAMKIEITTKKDVTIQELLTEDQLKELSILKSDIRNLHKPKIIIENVFGEDLL